jgi:hypothetical protein
VAALARKRRYVAPAGGRRRLPDVTPRLPGGGRLWLAGGITLAIVLCAFVSAGGTHMEPTTWTEVACMLAGAGLCALALVLPRDARTPARLAGGFALGAFALLAAYTALSANWSLMPDDTWQETNRTFSYLAIFAGGLALGRIVPGRWDALIAAVGASAVIICGWALLTKVFPAALAPDDPFGRLRPPFEYWNAVGLAAAIGIPPMLWLGARRSGHGAVNVLAWPALGVLIMCLLLSFSRGALLAIAIVIAIWIAAVPLRLRAAVMLGGVLAATLPLAAWAFAQEGLATDGAALPVRVDAGQALGALLCLLLVALTVAGLAVGFLSAVRPPSDATRRRASRVLIGALVTVPAVAILLLANAPGGIDGQLSKAWRQATDPAVSGPSNGPTRLTSASSGRAQYWREALKIHAHDPLLGTGAGSYGTLRLRYRIDGRSVAHAHGYGVQTLADLGWVGLGLSLLATIAWLGTTARVLGARRRDRGLAWDAERVGLATLAAVALVFGLHSTIDWTWFIPGNVMPALLCAGWVVSRATLRERLAGIAPPQPSDRSPEPLRVGAAVLVLAIAAMASWSALQPVRSSHALDAAADRMDRGALPQAASIAQIALKRDPLSVDALFELAAVESARGDQRAAQRALEQAVGLEPANFETWRRLGFFRLNVLKDKKAALRAFQAAYFLNPRSSVVAFDVLMATRLQAQP